MKRWPIVLTEVMMTLAAAVMLTMLVFVAFS